MSLGWRAARLALAAGFAWAGLEAQVVTAPEYARWGETLRVRYDPSASGAQLKASDAVWAAATVYFGNESAERRAGAMTLAPDGGLGYQFTVPEGACAIEIAFVTPHDYDAQAAATVMVLRQDGKAARGAYARLMWKHTGDTERYFQEEIATIRGDLEKIGAEPAEPSSGCMRWPTRTGGWEIRPRRKRPWSGWCGRFRTRP